MRKRAVDLLVRHLGVLVIAETRKVDDERTQHKRGESDFLARTKCNDNEYGNAEYYECVPWYKRAQTCDCEAGPQFECT